MVIAGVISGALLYIKDDFEAVKNSSFLQVNILNSGNQLLAFSFFVLSDVSILSLHPFLLDDVLSTG